MTDTMTYVIGVIKCHKGKGGFLFFQIAYGHFAQGSGVFVVIRSLLVITQCKRVYQVFDAVPFV